MKEGNGCGYGYGWLWSVYICMFRRYLSKGGFDMLGFPRGIAITSNDRRDILAKVFLEWVIPSVTADGGITMDGY